MNQSIKTIFVTDVPFWKKESGAQLRIDQLVENLASDPFATSVLVTRATDDLDLDAIKCKVPIELLDPSKPPKSGIWAKIRWQCDAIAHSLGWRPKPHSSTFEDYYPAAFVRRFVDFVLDTRPDVLIFEYATQTQLIRSLPDSVRQKIVTVLDTHDVLWKRAQQFEQQGQKHWIAVDQSTEESAYHEYDLIIAIQNDEANYIRSLLDEEKVIVTSMEYQPNASENSERQPESKEEHNRAAYPTGNNGDYANNLVIGFLASNNWTNVDTAEQILKCWPAISERFPGLELRIGGSICESDTISKLGNELQNANLLGRIEFTNDFYEQVDLIWNPVRFGTGLKIKNLEALAFGKCLVTSPHGFEGMTGENDSVDENYEAIGQTPITVLESPFEMIPFLSGLDSSLIEKLGRLGQKHLESNFGRGTQYPLLRQKIGALFSQKKE